MKKEIENLITKSAYRDIQIEMLKKEHEGMIISKEVVNEIIVDLEKKMDLDEIMKDQEKKESAEEHESTPSAGDEDCATCEYCQEKIVDEDEHNMSAGDESITICEACYEHLN